MHHIVNHEFDYILFLSGDQLYQMDFKAKQRNIFHSNASDATEFGILKTDEESFIYLFYHREA